MTCSSCIHWDRYTESELTKALGDCRFNPPTISEGMLARLLPGLSTPLADYDEIEHDLYVASAFPVTHQDNACGRYDGGALV